MFVRRTIPLNPNIFDSLLGIHLSRWQGYSRWPLTTMLAIKTPKLKALLFHTVVSTIWNFYLKWWRQRFGGNYLRNSIKWLAEGQKKQIISSNCLSGPRDKWKINMHPIILYDKCVTSIDILFFSHFKINHFLFQQVLVNGWPRRHIVLSSCQNWDA